MAVTNRPEGTTRAAQMECALWLGACLKLGWGKESLDALEEIWWKYHDRTGTLLMGTNAHRGRA